MSTEQANTDTRVLTVKFKEATRSSLLDDNFFANSWCIYRDDNIMVHGGSATCEQAVEAAWRLVSNNATRLADHPNWDVRIAAS